MPGKNKPIMDYGPKKFEDQKGTSPGITMADVIKARKDGYEAKMIDARAKMAMPKKNSPMNFKALDVEMARAMDYNNGKPMMDHGPDMYNKPKMSHGDKPGMYGKPKAYHDKK